MATKDYRFSRWKTREVGRGSQNKNPAARIQALVISLPGPGGRSHEEAGDALRQFPWPEKAFVGLLKKAIGTKLRSPATVPELRSRCKGGKSRSGQAARS